LYQSNLWLQEINKLVHKEQGSRRYQTSTAVCNPTPLRGRWQTSPTHTHTHNFISPQKYGTKENIHN